jgi:phage terminase large subunit-like protein
MIETPGNVTDYDYIQEKIKELAERYQIKSIAYDRYNASQLVIRLQADGFKMSPMGQGFVSMNTPTKELEKLVYQDKIIHAGNPVLRWMCSNILLREDPAGNIKIDRGKSTEKVDGMVALVMALGEFMTGEQTGPSVYDERGILTL